MKIKKCMGCGFNNPLNYKECQNCQSKEFNIELLGDLAKDEQLTIVKGMDEGSILSLN